jgi:hypothetical protein
MAWMFELEDKSWFPPLLRRMQTDFIGWMVMRFGVYSPLAETFALAFKQSNATTWVDLASGNGGPACSLLHTLKIQSLLSHTVQLQLTDLFPGFPKSLPADVTAFPQPYNACDSHLELPGFKSLFNAFHHFDESAKIALIKKHGPCGLFVVEILQPTFWVFLKIILITTVGQVFLAPFVRPFSWMRIVFTYLIPINIFSITFDGLMSVLRVDSLAVMHRRAEQHLPFGCSLHSGKSGPWWAPLSWFYIVPSNEPS